MPGQLLDNERPFLFLTMTRGRPVRFMCFNIFADRNFSLLSVQPLSPVSISHRTFEHTFVPRLVHHSPHHCYTVYYLQLQTLLRTFQTPLDKIDQRVQFLDTRYHVYFVRGIIKGGKKNHSRRVKREKSQREVKNFSTRNAPFTFFTPGFWTHVQKLVYMSPMELSIVRVYTPFHVFTSLLFLSFVKQ